MENGRGRTLDEPDRTRSRLLNVGRPLCCWFVRRVGSSARRSVGLSLCSGVLGTYDGKAYVEFIKLKDFSSIYSYVPLLQHPL